MDNFSRRAMFALAGGGVACAGLAHAQEAPGRSRNPPLAAQSTGRGSGGIRHIEVNGTRLGYRHHVGGGQRRPLVFGHGYALRGTGDIYEKLFARLAADFDVYALDSRGHGASAASFADWSQAVIADDVAAFVDKLGLRGAVYAGHSLGGFTGMYAQIRHPGTFSALALLATAVAAGGVAPPGLKESFVTRGRDRAFTQPAFAAMYLHPGPGDVARAVDAVSVIDPSVHETFFSNFPNVVITEQLGQIRVPVLLVNGGKDTVVSPAGQHNTALGLSRSKEVTFAGEGHMLPIESSDATAREMINFFRYDVEG